METVEALKQARQVLVEKVWTRGGFFADSPSGRSCYGWDEEACKFCALGALQHVLGYGVTWEAETNDKYHAAVVALEMAFGPMDGASVPYFNDYIASSIDDVLALYDRAIAKLESAP